MSIYLSGGGDAIQSFLLDQKFSQTIKKDRQIFYVPLALAPESHSFEDCFQWICTTFRQHKIDNIVMIKNIKELENIPDGSAIYIGGGNTYKLQKLLTESGKDNYLKEYLKTGGSVFGGSAGAIIFGKSIATASIGKDADVNHVGLKNLDGLNLINDLTIHCHYQNQDNSELMNYFKINNSPVLCLYEDSGIIYENNTITVIGYQPAYIITDRILQIDINHTFCL